MKKADLNKKVPQPPKERQPILRFARNHDEVLAASYVVPKEQASVLLEQAMKELYPNLDVDFEESIAMSIQVLEKINELLKR